MRRRVNRRVLLGLLLGTFLLGGGAYGFYVWQSRRTADRLLEQAEQAEQAGQFEEAASLLANYLGYRPKDNEQRARMGLLLEQAGTATTKAQAVGVFAKVLRAEPGRGEIRRRLVELAMGMDRFGDARLHLTVLLEESPGDPKLEHFLGRCAEAAREYSAAADWYEKARKHAPAQAESHARLAGILRRWLNESEQADQVMDEMTAAAPNSVQAWLARARYRKQYGTFQGWEEDLAQARKLASGDPDVLLASAEVSQARNDLVKARDLLQRALEHFDKRAGLYIALAGVELQGGRSREAVACLRRGFEKAGDSDELREALVEALLEAGELKEAGETIGVLRDKKFPKPWLDYLEARILMSKTQWREAARLLEPLRISLAAAPERAARVERALGQCHERIGNLTQAIDAFEKAAANDPRGLPARFALASSLLAAGRTAAAVSECRRIAALPQAPGGGLGLLARALIVHNLRLPRSERDWKEVDEVLARAAKAEPSSVEVAILRAEALAAQGGLDKARVLLDEARGRQPSEAALWIATVALCELQKKPEEILPLLAKAQEKLGERVELQTARVRYWAFRRGAEAEAALKEVQRGLSKLPDSAQPRLLASLGEARYLRGEFKEAEQLWSLLAEKQPSDLRTRTQLFDLALRAGDEERILRQVEALRKIEGEEGTFWRYGEAALLLLKAQRGKREGLAQAAAHLDDLNRRRPRWSRAALLAAGLDELNGNGASAVENYKRAISQGDDQLGVVRRLVQLLTDQQRYDEADGVLRKLKLDQLAEGGLLRLAAEVSLHRQETARALEFARQAVSSESADYRDHLWLGQLLGAAGKAEEAETALRRAAGLAGQDAAPWVALVECLARNGQKARAEATIKEGRGKLTPEQAPAVLARCFEAVGRLDEAEEQHKAVLALRPDSAAAVRGAAAFYLRTGQLRKAEPQLRKFQGGRLKAPDAERVWALQSLAVMLAQTGEHQHFREALAILESNKAEGETVEGERTRALVLATRPGRRREAIQLLQAVRRRQSLPEEDFFLLAQLHERERDWPSAQEALQALASSQRTNPQYLAFYARGLIRHGKAEEARSWVERLEKEEPKALATAEAKARFLAGTGKAKEAAAFLLEQAQSKNAPLLTLAALLEELGEGAAAEPLYRKYVLASRRAEDALVLPAYFGRQGQFANALALLDEAWKTCPPEAVAFAGVALLHAPRAGKGEFERVERGLIAALEKAPNSTPLLIHLATLRDLQGRFADAEEVYRRLLAREEGNVLALNNLAWLLAHQKGKEKEALDLLRRAIEAAGPLPELLDTRAVAYLNLRLGEPAIKDLEKAVEDYPTAARFCHLARAHLLAQDVRAAETALRNARSLGLKAELLHPLERAAYQAFLKELEQP